MTTNAKPTASPHAAEIRAVQTLRRAAGLADDDVWRDLLERLTGSRSLRVATPEQLAAVRRHLVSLAPAPRPQAPDQRGHGLPYSDTPTLRKIRAVWIVLAKAGALENRTDAALGAFIERQTGQELGRLENAAVDKVLGALKAIAKRAGVALRS